jgi:glycosyltransferase involved in cell wall biosynthesis
LNQNPLISIIVPSYNHGHLIHRALNSILAQTYLYWEVIIVDNHSSDKTEEIVSNFSEKRFRFYKINNNGVIAASRNFGIKKALGEWIAFLDSDDWWEPEKLDKAINYASKRKADLVFHNLKIVRKNFLPFGRSIGFYDYSKSAFNNLLYAGNSIPNSSVVIKKSTLQAVNLISEDKSKISWEDYDCWLKVSKLTNNFAYLDENLGFYWLGGGNISNPYRTLKNLESIYLEYISAFLMPPPFWFSYSLASALMQCGYYKDSFNILRKTTLKNIPPLNRLKYCIRYAQSLILKQTSNATYENMKTFICFNPKEKHDDE